MYEKEITRLIKDINELLKKTPSFQTKPENGYGHVKVEWDDIYEQPILWVATNVDKTMTLIDLQSLKDHIKRFMEESEND